MSGLLFFTRAESGVLALLCRGDGRLASVPRESIFASWSAGVALRGSFHRSTGGAVQARQPVHAAPHVIARLVSGDRARGRRAESVVLRPHGGNGITCERRTSPSRQRAGSLD